MKKLTQAFALIVALGLVHSAGALTFQLNYVFDPGSTAPAGTAPWVTVMISDAVGGVNLTITNSNLTGLEYTSELYLNLAPDLISTLDFTNPQVTGTMALPTVSQGLNAFKADGGGYFDLQLGFATASANRFGAGEAIGYFVTSSQAGFSAASFNLLSQPSGGNGVWNAAVHIGATPDGGAGSAWVGNRGGDAPPVVPDAGSTLGLLGTALLVLGILGRRNAAG